MNVIRTRNFYFFNIVKCIHIFLVFSVCVSSAQNKKAIIKNKFVKKTENSKKIRSKYSSLKQDLIKIPVDFIAQNPVDLYKILKKRSVETSKDEFETTQQFEERNKNKRDEHIIGNLTEDSLFVFKPKSNNLDYSTFIYNADNQIIELALKPEIKFNHSKCNLDEMDVIKLDKFLVKDNYYKGVNAFGVTKEVHETEEKNYFLIIENWNEFDGERFTRTDFSYQRFNNILKLNFKVDPKTAKLIKENDLYSDFIDDKVSISKCQLSSLYIGKIIKPFTCESNYISDKASLSSPYEYVDENRYIKLNLQEIWIYNKNSGEVYIKLKRQL